MAIVRQGITYTAVGGVQLLLDFICFVALTTLAVPAAYANLFGRIAGALLGFWLNGRATFSMEGNGGLKMKHFARFMISWISMTTISTIVVTLSDDWRGIHTAWIVKPCIDGALAIAGFIISRHWIYR